MSFYVPNLDDIHEPEPVEDGAFELEIINAERRTNDKGTSWINVAISILNPPEDGQRPPLMYHTLFLPNEGSTKSQEADSLLKVKRFAVFFAIDLPDHPLTEGEIDEWVTTWPGARSAGKVRKTYNERTERYQNELVVPSLPSKGHQSAARSAPAGLRSV